MRWAANISGKRDGKHGKVSLKTRVNSETTRCGIHTRHVLTIVNLLERQLLSIVPVLVVEMLSQECVRLHSSVGVHLGHVHVVDEVDETFGAWRAVVAAGFLFERLLEHALQHLRGCVKVKRHVDNHPVLAKRVELVVDEHGLACARGAHQHDWSAFFDQQVDEIANSSGLGRVDQCRLNLNKFNF